jgi:uncharacterized protein (TIGR02147 family)
MGARGERKGMKTTLAKVLCCQPTYISQVLNGNAHLSLEQAEGANKFFGHTKDECHYFLLLLQKERAGTITLKKYFEEQIQDLALQRMKIEKRLGKNNTLDVAQKSVYYSSWHYAAIHMAITIPTLRTRESIANYLHIPLKRVNVVLEFLLSSGLARHTASGFQANLSEILLGNDSDLIYKHHTNWRNQAIESLEREDVFDLHYSAVVSISSADRAKIKDILLEVIQKNLELIRDSKEEDLYSICIDFFGMNR